MRGPGSRGTSEGLWNWWRINCSLTPVTPTLLRVSKEAAIKQAWADGGLARGALAFEEQRLRGTGARCLHHGGHWMPKAAEHQTGSSHSSVEGAPERAGQAVKGQPLGTWRGVGGGGTAHLLRSRVVPPPQSPLHHKGSPSSALPPARDMDHPQQVPGFLQAAC